MKLMVSRLFGSSTLWDSQGDGSCTHVQIGRLIASNGETCRFALACELPCPWLSWLCMCAYGSLLHREVGYIRLVSDEECFEQRLGIVASGDRKHIRKLILCDRFVVTQLFVCVLVEWAAFSFHDATCVRDAEWKRSLIIDLNTPSQSWLSCKLRIIDLNTPSQSCKLRIIHLYTTSQRRW